MLFLTIKPLLRTQQALPFLPLVDLEGGRSAFKIAQRAVLEDDRLLDDMREELLVMGDENQRAVLGSQEVLKPDYSLKILWYGSTLGRHETDI